MEDKLNEIEKIIENWNDKCMDIEDKDLSVLDYNTLLEIKRVLDK